MLKSSLLGFEKCFFLRQRASVHSLIYQAEKVYPKKYGSTLSSGSLTKRISIQLRSVNKSCISAFFFSSRLSHLFTLVDKSVKDIIRGIRNLFLLIA